ncbi:MAG: hypothetical protein N2316_00805 [Spirochaetes bacterium]|nr:hypothetical protein [Spirochaetota bacterium]
MKIVSSIVCFFMSMPLYSYDSLTLLDGKILLGKIVSVEREKVVVESFGKEKIYSSSEILKTSKGAADLKKISVSVYLRDGTVLQGKFEDYDEEIGILLNLQLGNITIVPDLIEKISDETLTTKYYGFDAKIGMMITYYRVIGEFRNDFDSSYALSAYGEKNFPLVRGISFGLDFSYRNMGYVPSEDVRYVNISLKPTVTYSYHDFHYLFPFSERITPFVQLAIGPSYIHINDERNFVKSTRVSGIDTEMSASAGVDVHLYRGISFRLSPTYCVVFQRKRHFQTMAVGFGIYYGF